MYPRNSLLTEKQVNIKGPFITAQAFLPTKGDDSVVVVSSTMGVTFPAAGAVNLSSYVASKLGLMKFIEVLAAENPDVRFTTIHPGAVETDMYRKAGLVGLPSDKGILQVLACVFVHCSKC